MVADFNFSIIEGFDWDKGNLEHIEKHKVIYTECEEIFSNLPLIINKDESHSLNEGRFRAFGQTNKNRFLIVIFTIRSNKIRVVSARDQKRRERNEFREVGGEKL